MSFNGTHESSLEAFGDGNVPQITGKDSSVSVSVCSMPKSCETFDPINVVSVSKSKRGERSVSTRYIMCLAAGFTKSYI